MKKLITLFLAFAFAGILFNSCKQDTVCLECTITIAGIEDVKDKLCDDLETVNKKEAEYQEIVDRENSIVGQSASLKCKKYILP